MELKTYIIIKECELKGMIDLYTDLYESHNLPLDYKQIDKKCIMKEKIVALKNTIKYLKEYYKTNYNIQLDKTT